MPSESRRRRRHSGSSTPARKAMDLRWLPLMLAAFLFVLWSVLWCIADLEAFRARAWAETWENLTSVAAGKGLPYEPDPDDWALARRHAEHALSLAPLSSEYHEVLARIYVSRYPAAPVGDALAQPYLEKAAALYREAIRLRPTWPYNYTGLAYTLRRMGRLDAEYEQSMRDALRHGPWEPNVMRSVVRYNLDVLSQLQPSTRQLVLDTLMRGQGWTQDMQGNPVPYGDQVWGEVVVRHKQWVACGWLPMNNPQIRFRCSPANI